MQRRQRRAHRLIWSLLGPLLLLALLGAILLRPAAVLGAACANPAAQEQPVS